MLTAYERDDGKAVGKNVRGIFIGLLFGLFSDLEGPLG